MQRNNGVLRRALQMAFAVGAIATGTALAQTPAATTPEPAPPPAAPTPDNTVTANVGIFSQYIFRGLSQTDERPALQGGFDYSHVSGFYAGLWGSNISWISDFDTGASASLELDTYLGFRNSFMDDWGYDVGYLRYNYPGNYPADYVNAFVKADTDELYAQLSWKWISFKFSDSLGKTFGVPDAQGTYYANLTAAVPLPSDLTLTLHVGRQKYKGTNHLTKTPNNLASYTDSQVELAYAINKEWTVAGGFTSTNAKKAVYTPGNTNRFIGENQGYAYLKRTF